MSSATFRNTTMFCASAPVCTLKPCRSAATSTMPAAATPFGSQSGRVGNA